jgi:hypothetical protein
MIVDVPRPKSESGAKWTLKQVAGIALVAVTCLWIVACIVLLGIYFPPLG